MKRRSPEPATGAGPPLARDILPRRRLLWPIDDPAGPVATFLIAPSGYGKTTLMAQHHGIAAATQRCLWLSADQGIGAGSDLASALRGCLGRSLPAGTAEHGVDADPLEAVLAAIAADGAPVSIYLDDVPAGEIDARLGTLHRLVTAAPANLRLVCSCRRKPALDGWMRCVANGRIRVIGVDRLRFSPSESKAFLTGARDARWIEEGVRRAEGWAGGLRFWRLADDRDDGRSRGASDLRNVNVDVDAYFEEEAFRPLDDGQRRRLMQISVLDRITPELVEELCACPGAAEMLRRLSDENAFIFAVDGHRSEYRLHTLFREFLLDRLRRDAALDERALRRRAAEWLLARERYGDAIAQAVAVGDLAYLAEVAERIGGWRLSLAFGVDIWASLARLPDDALKRHRALALAKAYHCLHHGHAAEARALQAAVADALELLPATPAFDVERRELALFDLLAHLYEDKIFTPQERAAIAATLFDEQASADPRTAALAEELTGWERLGAGRFDEAIGHCSKAIGMCRASHAHFIHSYTHLALAAAYLAQGQLCASGVHIDQASTVAAPATSATRAVMANACKAELLLEQGAIAGARDAVLPAWDAFDQLDLWVDFAASIVATLSWVRLHEGAIDQAHALIGVAVARSAGRNLPRLGLMLQLQRLAMTLACDDAAGARDLIAALRLEAVLDAPHVHWRIGIEGALLLAEARLADGDPAAARPALGRAAQDIGRLGALRYRPRLLVLEARLRSITGESDAALGLFDDALKAAAGERQALPFLNAAQGIGGIARAWLGRRGGQTGTGWAADLCRDVAAASRSAEPAPAVFVPPALSRREGEIFRLICLGYSSKEIARTLYLSINTVTSYRRTVYEKLGVSSRSNVVQIGLRDSHLPGSRGQGDSNAKGRAIITDNPFDCAADQSDSVVRLEAALMSMPGQPRGLT